MEISTTNATQTAARRPNFVTGAGLYASRVGAKLVRSIRFIVSFAAGGTPDIPCRLVTERIGNALGQQIFVENRAGGGTSVARHRAPLLAIQ
jgi:tripartite-type tricarboxylate transporter receptor subunit TctC